MNYPNQFGKSTLFEQGLITTAIMNSFTSIGFGFRYCGLICLVNYVGEISMADLSLAVYQKQGDGATDKY